MTSKSKKKTHRSTKQGTSKKAARVTPESEATSFEGDKNERQLRRLTLWALLLACSFTSLLYLPSIDGHFIFDDTPNIELNEAIRWGGDSEPSFGELSFSNPNYRRPVAYATFGVNHLLHGYDTRGYRITNLLIHLLNGLALYALVIATFNTPAMRNKRESAKWVALAATLLFLVHPVAVQSVAYIVQRMTSLASLFYLLSLLLYAKARLASRHPLWLFAGCATAGLVGLGCKENTATLPVVILLYELYFFRDLQWRNIRGLAAPSGIVIAASIVIVLLFLGDDPLSRLTAGYSTREFTLAERLLTEMRVVVRYITLFVFPHPNRLNLDYDFLLSTSLLSPITTLLSLLLLVGLAAFATASAKRWRLLSFAIWFFLINLMIESSVVPLEIIYEHRTYLPFTFLFVTLAYYLIGADKGFPARAGIVIALVLASTFAWWTYQRAVIWSDEVLLWQDAVSKSPSKARPHHNLGVALRDQKRYQEAIPALERAVELDPGHIRARQNLADALYNTGAYAAALSRFQEVAVRDPGYTRAHLGRANSLYKLDLVEPSIAAYRQYVGLEPQDADAHLKLGIALAETGKIASAAEHFRRVVQLDDGNIVARRNLAVLMFNQREDAEEVIRLLEEASALDPDNADILADLGLVLSETPRRGEAIPVLKRALALDRNHPAAGELLEKLE